LAASHQWGGWGRDRKNSISGYGAGFVLMGWLGSGKVECLAPKEGIYERISVECSLWSVGNLKFSRKRKFLCITEVYM
jgi:hypothetical protein